MILFMVICSIFCASWMKGKLFRCESSYLHSSSYTAINSMIGCLHSGGIWLTCNPNFNNVVNGTYALFEMTSAEEWIRVMWLTVDATQIDQGMMRERRMNWAIFHVGFMMVGCLLFTNMFVGVVVNQQNNVKQLVNGNAFLDPKQAKWSIMKKMLLKTKPALLLQPPNNIFRSFCYHLSKHR